MGEFGGPALAKRLESEVPKKHVSKGKAEVEEEEGAETEGEEEPEDGGTPA